MDVRRRELLAGAAVALAGCSDVEERISEVAPPRGHPLEGTTTVTVVNRSTSSHDLETLAGESLAFWEANASQYAGFEVDFQRVESDPDVEIEFLNSREELDGCREHSSENVLGCAPLLREGNRFDRPATAEVVATGRPYGEVRVTTKHEIGHLLGLDHDAEPAYIMSNRIEDRLPEYQSRVAVLEAFESAWKTRSEGTTAYNEGIELWNDREYEQAVDPFRRAEERYRSIADSVAEAERAAEAFEEMNRPETVDRERLATYFETTRTVADLLVEAAAAMRAAAEAAADGDRDTAQGRRDDANDALESVRAIDAPTPRDIARALGLVRDEEFEEGSGPSGT